MKPPFWKNPYLLGFAVGVVFLTVLPFIQRPFLRAPPPVKTLAPWELSSHRGGKLGAQELKGRVWVASLYCTQCSPDCIKRQGEFSRLGPHLADVKGGVPMVSISVDPQIDTPEASASHARRFEPNDSWTFATGSTALAQTLFAEPLGLVDGGTASLCSAAVFALVDQDGALRGFWPSNDLGRGNLVNAARLLVKYGPAP